MGLVFKHDDRITTVITQSNPVGLTPANVKFLRSLGFKVLNTNGLQHVGHRKSR